MMSVMALLVITTGVASAQDLQTITDLSKRLDTVMFENDAATIASVIDDLQTAVSALPATQSAKDDLVAKADRVAGIWNGTIEPSAPNATVIDVLRANNELYGASVAALYDPETASMQKEAYELTYLASRVRLEILAGDWRSVKDGTAGEVYDWWADVRPRVTDDGIRRDMDIARSDLANAIATEDVAAGFKAAQDMQAVSTKIDSALTEAQAAADAAAQSTMLWKLLLAVVFFGVVGYWWYRRR